MLQGGGICGIYATLEDAEKYITTFAKEFAKRAVNDEILGEIKRKLHTRALEKCDDVAFTPDDIIIVRDFIKNGPSLAPKKP